MKRHGVRGWMVLFTLLALQCVGAVGGVAYGQARRKGECREYMLRFYGLVGRLRFEDAQRYVEDLRKIASDTSWHTDYLVRSATALRLYYERRERAWLDSLESLYEESDSHPCRWTYGWLGLVLSREYSRNANPAVALMYARASVQALREVGDSVLTERAEQLLQLSCWQLGDRKTLRRRLDSTSCSVRHASDTARRWRAAMGRLVHSDWRGGEAILDTLRAAYYEAGDCLQAGFVAQIMAIQCLRQHAPERALRLLRWIDSMPSQRVPSGAVFASWFLYGCCYAARGDYAKAIASYRRAEADAERVQAKQYRAIVLTKLADAYVATGLQRQAYMLKREAVELRDSVSSVLSVKLFQSADNMRALREHMQLYENQIAREKHDEALRTRRKEAILVLLAFAIIFVEVLLYRLGGVLAEKRRQRVELQTLTASLKQRGRELLEQGERLEQLHAEGVWQTDQQLRVHATLRSRAAKIMQSMDYASFIQRGLLPTEQERNALFADSFLITRALQAVSGDLFWLGSRGGVTVAAMVDCTGYGVAGASLSFIAYMLLNSVVRERGGMAPAEVLQGVDRELRQLLQGAESHFQGEQDIEISVLTIDSTAQVARFSGEGRQLFYSLDGRTVQNLQGQAYSLRESVARGIEPPTVTIRYDSGAQFYLMTDGFERQLNADNEKLGMQRVALILERGLQLPMREQRQELLGLFARHRLAQDQTDDITVCGMRLA